ncbi:Cof-like hydrolase [Candidatus Desulforudis audaxviator]|nr:Cof-like hydrolase [Candidatus Desulforudis audaxviator]
MTGEVYVWGRKKTEAEKTGGLRSVSARRGGFCLPDYRLVAVDLDDTLLTSGLEVSPRAGRAISRAQALGVVVTLATGRMYLSAVPFARRLGIDAPIITYQGALVKHPVTGAELLHRALANDTARAVIERLRAYGYHLNVYLDDQLYMEVLTELGKRYADLSRVEAHPVGDLLVYLGDRNPTKVLAIGGEDEIERLEQEMIALFPAERVHITRSKPKFLEFSHPLATKGRALQYLAAYYGIPREAVMAIGDGYNDLDMVAWAGLGIMMDNARDEVKRYADHVTASNDADGVAEAIERFVLGR